MIATLSGEAVELRCSLLWGEHHMFALQSAVQLTAFVLLGLSGLAFGVYAMALGSLALFKTLPSVRRGRPALARDI